MAFPTNKDTAISPFHYRYDPKTVLTPRDIEEALVAIQNNHLSHGSGFPHLKRLLAAFYVDYAWGSNEQKLTPLITQLLTAANIRELAEIIYNVERYSFVILFEWLYDIIDVLVALNNGAGYSLSDRLSRQEVSVLTSVGIVDRFGFLSIQIGEAPIKG